MLVRKKTLIFFIFCCAFSLQTTAQKSETKNICSGTSTTLTATTGDSYLWSPGGATTSSVTVSPTATTNYTCAVTTNGTTFNTGNLILGGDFEFTIPTGLHMGSQLKLTGNITDPITNITSNLYTQMNNFGSGMTSETAGLLDIGGAMTTTDPYLLKDTPAASDCGGSYFIHLEDHTKADGTGKMLAVDGSSGGEIWRSGNMHIKPGKTYQFSCWVANIDAQFGTSASHTDPITGTTIITSHDINTLAELTFKIETGNGSSTFPTFTVSQTVGNWTEYTGTYTVPGTGPSTWCDIWLTNSTADADGNDFAIDDIYFGLEQSTSPVTITDNFTVNVDTKATISMANITDCANKNTTLSATVTGGTNNTIAWTKNSAATAGTTNSLPITVPATIGNTDTYTISVTSGVCSAVTSSATVKAISCTSNQKDTICSNTTLVLNSSNTNTYTGISWTPSTGLSDASNATPTFTPTSSGDFQFIMTGTNTSTSTTETITVNVNVQEPATVSLANQTVCENSAVTLAATVSGGTNNIITWTQNGTSITGSTSSISSIAPTVGNTDTYRITITPTGVCPAVFDEGTVSGISCSSIENDTICLNSSVILNNSNTNTYTGISWTPTTGLSDASNATPTFTPTSSGDFQFIMTGTNTSTSTTETITVNVNVQEPATVSLANQTVCENSAVTLAATVSGGTNNIITWTQNGTSITGSTSSISSIAPTVGNTDTYRITITPTGVCPAVFDEGTVSGISCSSIENDTICLNSSVILNNSNTNTYTGISWTPTTGLSDASNATPTFTPTSSGDFQFIMTGTNTSTSTTETITVNVNVKDCGITTVIDTTVCAKDSIIVGPQIYRTSGSYSYTFVGGSQLGADSTVIVNLTVVEINIIASKTEICIEESLSLEGSANNNLTWTAQWTALPTELGINSSTAKTTAVNGTTDGNFDVTLSASVTKSGSVILATPLVCTAKIPITVHSNPVISEIFTTGRNATIILSTNEGTAPFTYTIDNEDYIVSSLSDLAIGEHSVEITDAEGCKTSGIFNIVPVPIIPAKFFSPNGDGVNDRWVVKGIDFYPGAIIQIFDRFGKELISYHGYDLGWDGTYDGKMMMTTDYWYLITIDEITKVISGHFTLKK